jgi:Tfp pilus assembly protein PilW
LFQIEWTSQHDSAVDQLKEALVNAAVTAYFDPAKDTEISVDASPVGLAAILSQVDGKTGTHHIVTYASRSLSETEQRYSQTEREALAVVWACEHLHLYIYGKPVTIYTDHKPLVSIYGNPSSKPPARIERWALRLQPYQLTVRYRKGEGNPADYLSRHPSKQPTTASREQKIAEEYVNYITVTSTPKALTVQEIEEATKADATLQAVSKAIETGNWQEGPKQSDVDSVAYTAWQKVKEELTVGVTAQIILRGTRIAVPRKLQERVVNLAHEGHQGVVKTKSLLREKVWFPSIDKLVEKKVESCCAFFISTPESKREPLKMSPLPKAPWSEVSMDFAELPNSEYLLIITDDYSRYPVVETVKSTSANTVIPRVDKMFSEFGIPDTDLIHTSLYRRKDPW